jgi:secreted trypsin-like serine protease
LCKPGEVCCRIPKTTTVKTTTRKSILSTFLKPAIQINDQKCGKRGGRIEKRILFDVSEDTDYDSNEEESDNTAVFGEFPWMVELRRKNRKTGEFEYLCGGVLINPSTVLTVSHNVRSIKKPSNLVIRAGEWDRFSTFEYLPHQDRIASRIINHPQYYSGGLYNDIAIIKFSQPLDMTQSNVQSICLPDEHDVFNGQICSVTGWGKDNFKDGKHSQILKYVDLPVVESRACEKSLQDFKFGQRFRLHESFLCAGGKKNEDSNIIENIKLIRI